MAARHETLRAVAQALPTPIGLLGLGVEGRETLRWLLDHGVTDIQVFDRAVTVAPPELGELPASVRFLGGEGWEAALPRCGSLVRSPGIRPDHPALQAAAAAGARITSATRLFLAHCPAAVVGVTGTVGKGTTVSLIEAALRGAGRSVRVGSNIGVNPLAFLDELSAEDTVVLELSSFQLMDLDSHHPQVAVVLRTTTEHLDWHPDVLEYRRAKAQLIAPPEAGQQVIYCADAEGSRGIAETLPGAWAVSTAGPVADGIGREQGAVHRYREGRGDSLPSLERLTLPGRFNLENAAAAALAVEALGISLESVPGQAALRAIAAFAGLPHRLEPAGTVPAPGGTLRCFNDSYATRPDATLGALGAFEGEALALILGGSEKHADFTELGAAIAAHPSLRQVVLIGQTAPRLAAAIRAGGATPPPLAHAATLAEAVQAALAALRTAGGPGVLLFSPACASFDMFPNYKVRGERFKALVAGLAE